MRLPLTDDQQIMVDEQGWNNETLLNLALRFIAETSTAKINLKSQFTLFLRRIQSDELASTDKQE